MSTTVENASKGPPAPISEIPFLKLFTGSEKSKTEPHSEPVEPGIVTDRFLTGLVCLEPVSKACISRLLDLLKDKPEPAAPATPEEEHGILHLMDSFLHDYLREQTEQLGKGILQYLEKHPPASPPAVPLSGESFRRYFPRRPLVTPAPSAGDVECEVKKDANGEIRVECEAS